MFWKKGDFLYLTGGFILEVMYADEEKAVCIEVQKEGKKYRYTEKSVVIPNEKCFYEGKTWICQTVPQDVLKIRWRPFSEIRLKTEWDIDDAIRTICQSIRESNSLIRDGKKSSVPEMAKALAELITARNQMEAVNSLQNCPSRKL